MVDALLTGSAPRAGRHADSVGSRHMLALGLSAWTSEWSIARRTIQARETLSAVQDVVPPTRCAQQPHRKWLIHRHIFSQRKNTPFSIIEFKHLKTSGPQTLSAARIIL